MAEMKVVTNTSKSLEVMVDGGKLVQVDSLGHLESRITNDVDCKGEVKARLAMDMVPMVKLTKNKTRQ